VSTKLVIVESPNKVRSIAAYLGAEFDVEASVGHIRDLAQPSELPPAEKKGPYGKFAVDVEDGFKPYYVVNPDKKKTVTQLRKALKGAEELYLATDDDREGEAIAWHLLQVLKPKVPVRRMTFTEITKEAVTRALASTRDLDIHLVDAQETRRILDRLVGYEVSPVLWRKVRAGLSAGRVQSVATRLVVERERERMAFVSAGYWGVEAEFAALPGAGASSISEDADARRANAFTARYGWDAEPLETAYGQCLNSDLIFYRQLRKNKLSPNKKQYLSVFAYCDFLHLKISWQVSDRKKNIQYKGELAWWPPSNIDEIYGLDFQWINDSEFVIHSKYKGIRVNSWQISLAE